MHAFTYAGSLEDLKAYVNLLHETGHWSHEGAFELYRLETGETINYWPDSGQLQINGHPDRVAALTERLQTLIRNSTQA